MDPREPHRRAPSRGAIAAAIILVWALAAGPVAAQEPPTTTTAPAEPSTTPDPNAPTTVPDPNASTTTTVVDPLAASPEALSSGVYGGQLPFDPSSTAVLGTELRTARRTLADAEDRYAAAQGAIDATTSDLQELADQITVVGIEREDNVADASAAKASLHRRAVAAYVRGDDTTPLMAAFGDPADFSRAQRYLEALAGQDRATFDTYQRRIALMNDAERRLVDDQADLQTRADALATERNVALRVLLDARRCADTYAAGGHACPSTFVFPVLGEVSFADTWGAPRMPGSPDAHWHEGTDIMAPEGREVVAVENGTLFKVGGDAGLGGLRLWLHGESGIDYYYAHFSGFAPSMVDGASVAAGTVVGHVGSTGNASGGPAHVHFEVHPGGTLPINPYPLLKSSWGRRTMPPESAIMKRLPSVAGTLPPEER